MINLGLRMHQILAERADITKMNMAERTSWWFRLERIGREPDEPTAEPHSAIKQYTYVNLDKEAFCLNQKVKELEGRINSLQERIRIGLNAKAKRDKFNP